MWAVVKWTGVVGFFFENMGNYEEYEEALDEVISEIVVCIEMVNFARSFSTPSRYTHFNYSLRIWFCLFLYGLLKPNMRHFYALINEFIQ